MSPILSSCQGVILATAAVAVSGTAVILLAFRFHKSFPPSPPPLSRIASDRKAKKKRVHFAEDVIEPKGDGEEYRKSRQLHSHGRRRRRNPSQNPDSNSTDGGGRTTSDEKMPANRVALYNGILRDRQIVHRFSYSR